MAKERTFRENLGSCKRRRVGVPWQQKFSAWKGAEKKRTSRLQKTRRRWATFMLLDQPSTQQQQLLGFSLPLAWLPTPNNCWLLKQSIVGLPNFGLRLCCVAFVDSNACHPNTGLCPCFPCTRNPRPPLPPPIVFHDVPLQPQSSIICVEFAILRKWILNTHQGKWLI